MDNAGESGQDCMTLQSIIAGSSTASKPGTLNKPHGLKHETKIQDARKHLSRQVTSHFVNIFLKGKLKVVYEVSRWEGYFKKRLREKFPTQNGLFWEASQ
jgi:hypothetical protein